MRRVDEALIYDWNQHEPRPGRRVVLLNDETLRDGLQSPSVRAPTIDQKLEILHLLDRIGIDTADIGLPGAGPHVVKDVERLATEIRREPSRMQANCAARTMAADIQPIADIVQRTGLPIECCCFIGSSPHPPLCRRLDGRLSAAVHGRGGGVCGAAGADVMYVTEDTTRSDPDTLRRLFQAAHARRGLAHLHR